MSFQEKASRDFYKQAPVPTYFFGGGLSFQVRKNFFMHTAVVYMRKGENLSSNAAPNLMHKEIYHSIDMPILFTREFKMTVGNDKVLKWYGGIGPNLSYWLNGKGSLYTLQQWEDGSSVLDYKFSFQQAGDNPDPSTVYVPDANRLQLGINLAAGFIFEPLGYQRVHVNFRYEIGHSFMARDGMETFQGINDYHGDLKARMKVFCISLSYLIDLKTAEKNKGRSTSTLMKKKRR
ncbi:hypothetical protein WSM22_25030 [Cytophagales bacterium WSM2-2]|nr:hypothetical protein WSM22_25030 [Cytophagales bacterium WSM2-2]